MWLHSKSLKLFYHKKRIIYQLWGGHGIEARLLGAKLAIKAESPDLASTFLWWLIWSCKSQGIIVSLLI